MLPFVEKVTSDSGGDDNNTQIYFRLRKKAARFQGFSPLLFLRIP